VRELDGGGEDLQGCATARAVRDERHDGRQRRDRKGESGEPDVVEGQAADGLQVSLEAGMAASNAPAVKRYGHLE
jgi:hypothetical protein